MGQKTIQSQRPELVRVCVPDAYGKCECGGTIKTVLDWQLHRCVSRKSTEQIYDNYMTIADLRIL
jgi:hypothetical protein